LIRLSATSSLLLFALAWSASSVNLLLPGRWRPVMQARRRIGISFAISHSFHLAAIAWLVELAFGGDWSEVDPLGGAVIYTLIYLMAFSSNDAAVRLLGVRQWRWLHKIGSYLIWGAFTQSYIANTFQRDGFHYPLFAGLCVGLLLVRIIAFNRQRAVA
jgi:DMSO/TMAO reductase YedYZ heme-binding membrane subunit